MIPPVPPAPVLPLDEESALDVPLDVAPFDALPLLLPAVVVPCVVPLAAAEDVAGPEEDTPVPLPVLPLGVAWEQENTLIAASGSGPSHAVLIKQCISIESVT
jgi:hypothetical protein